MVSFDQASAAPSPLTGETSRPSFDAALKALGASGVVGLAVSRGAGRIVQANDALLELLGYSMAEVEDGQLSWLTLTPPEYRHLDTHAVEACLRGQACPPYEKVLVHRDGRHVQAQVGPSRSSEHAGTDEVAWFIIPRTAHPRSATQVTLDADARLRQVLQLAPLGVNLSRDQRLLYANPAFIINFGLESGDAALGRSIMDLVAPECQAEVFDLNRRRERGEPVPMQYETVGMRPDGTRFPLLLQVARIDLPDGPATLAFTTDLTATRRAEQQAREHERQLTRALDAARAAMWVWEIDSGNFWAEGGCLAVCGAERRVEGSIKAMIERIVPQDQEQFRRAAGKALTGDGTFACEFRVNGHDGQVVWIQATGEMQFADVAGIGRAVAERVTGVMRDVTLRRRAEDALRESEARFRAAAEGSLDAFFIFTCVRDQKGKVIDFEFADMNSRAEDLIGRSRSELQGKRWCEEYPIARTQGLFDVFAEVVRTRCPTEHESPLCAKERASGGPAIQVRHQIVPLADGVAVSTRDVTESRAAQAATEHANASLRALIAASPLAVILLDTEARVRLWSPAAERVFGWAEQEVLGQFHPIVPPEAMAEFKAQFAQVLTSRRNTCVTGRRRRKDGTTIDVDVWAAPVTDAQAQVTGVFALIADATERTRAADALRAAKADAESANAAKDRFLAVLSHELRTPLTPALATISALQADPSLPREVCDDLAVASRNIELQASLIDDLLDLTRVGRGKLELALRTLDVREVVRQALHVCGVDIRAKGLALQTHLDEQQPLWVSADAFRLQQVVWNLVKNAVKFTPAGGTITVHAARSAGGRIQISITDSGIGIEPDRLSFIFEPFEQANPSIVRRFGGLGLGLAISRALVEMHGGELRAHSDGPGRGATFVVELPMSAEPQNPRTNATPSVLANGTPTFGKTVLLVEDHADTLQVLSRLLKVKGIGVVPVGTLAQAKSAASQNHIDLVISDLGLPDGTGFELMAHLRDVHGLRGIALSGLDEQDQAEHSQDVGFVEHLVKPVDLAQLEAVVRRHL